MQAPKPFSRALAGLVLLGLTCASAQAQTFRLYCDLEGTIPVLEDKKLKPARVTVEMQSIGKNIFFKLVGPRYYDMKVSSLTTETFTGKNLTTGAVIGARARHNDNGRETEIRIERESIQLTGYSDIDYRGKVLRMNLDGRCTMP
jgi:hypothetical protein